MLNEKKVVPKLPQEVKGKVDIVTSDDIKIYYTGKFQDFTVRYMINEWNEQPAWWQLVNVFKASGFSACQLLILYIKFLHDDFVVCICFHVDYFTMKAKT